LTVEASKVTKLVGFSPSPSKLPRPGKLRRLCVEPGVIGVPGILLRLAELGVPGIAGMLLRLAELGVPGMAGMLLRLAELGVPGAMLLPGVDGAAEMLLRLLFLPQVGA